MDFYPTSKTRRIIRNMHKKQYLRYRIKAINKPHPYIKVNNKYHNVYNKNMCYTNQVKRYRHYTFVVDARIRSIL